MPPLPSHSRLPETCRRLALGLACLLAALPCRGQDPVAKAAADFLNRKLTGVVIPNIEFKSVALGDAVEFLRQEAVRLDPERAVGTPNHDVNIVLIKPPAADRVTLNLRNALLGEVLRQVADQAGMTVAVTPYDVRLVPVSMGKLDDAALVEIAPNGGPEAAKLQARLENVILPNIEFRATPLRDLIPFLQQCASQQTAADLTKLSLSIIPPTDPQKAAGRATITASRIPLLEIMRLVCLQMDLKMQITQDSVVLLPAKD